MRKRIVLSFLIILLVMLSSCANNSTSNENIKDNVQLNTDNETNAIKDTIIGGANPRLVYASSKKVIIQDKYLIVFDIINSTINCSMDLSEYNLQDIQGENAALVNSVDACGEVVFMHKPRQREWYRCDLVKQKIERIESSEVDIFEKYHPEYYIGNKIESGYADILGIGDARYITLEPLDQEKGYETFEDISVVIYDADGKMVSKHQLYPG